MSEYMSFLHEVFTGFGPVQSRSMFGGYGVYFEGLMFGLVADDCLYLKVDNSSGEAFTARGLMPFEYQRNGRTIEMSYFQAPEEIYEDEDEAAKWAQRAHLAALAAQEARGRH